MYKGWQGVVGEARGGNYTNPKKAHYTYKYVLVPSTCIEVGNSKEYDKKRIHSIFLY